MSYPEDYPDVAPHLDLSTASGAPKYPHLDIASDKDALLSSLTEVITDNLGMQMVFTLVSTLKDSAEQLILERQSTIQAQVDAKAAAVEEAENAKFHGEKVTRERFLEWRERFRQEMEEGREREKEEREAEDKKKRVKVEEKMTGKMLFLKGLAKGGEIEDDDDVEEVGKVVESLKIEA